MHHPHHPHFPSLTSLRLHALADIGGAQGSAVRIDALPRLVGHLSPEEYVKLKNGVLQMCESGRPMDGERIPEDYINASLSDMQDLVWHLTADNAVYGYAVAAVHSSDFGKILHITLICSERGYGKTLFDTVLHYAREQGFAQVEIDPLNDTLERLYLKWGKDANPAVAFTRGSGLGGARSPLYASLNGND